MIRNIIVISLMVLAASVISDIFIVNAINDIKQDIVDIKKDFSYDPKDAK